VTAFGQSAAAYNAEGGTVFDIAAPTHDPQLTANFLDASQSTIASEADMTRGFLVFV
jgi:hypothetical protein